MSQKLYNDDCPGCRPALVDLQTGTVLADDHPAMVKAREAWKTTSLACRIAFHNVTCNNSRRALDLRLAQQYIYKLHRLMNESDPKLN